MQAAQIYARQFSSLQPHLRMWPWNMRFCGSPNKCIHELFYLQYSSWDHEICAGH